MQYIQGKNREQSVLFPQSLDEIISADNEVRIIDLFAESIDLAGFKFVTKTREGRPAYNPKIYLSFLCTVISTLSAHRGCWKKNATAMWK